MYRCTLASCFHCGGDVGKSSTEMREIDIVHRCDIIEKCSLQLKNRTVALECLRSDELEKLIWCNVFPKLFQNRKCISVYATRWCWRVARLLGNDVLRRSRAKMVVSHSVTHALVWPHCSVTTLCFDRDLCSSPMNCTHFLSASRCLLRRRCIVSHATAAGRSRFHFCPVFNCPIIAVSPALCGE